MTLCQEEQTRQAAQQAFQQVIQERGEITAAMRAPLVAYDREHTPTESLAMRQEALVDVPLENVYFSMVELRTNYITALARVGSEQDKQDYLANEQAVLEYWIYPDRTENE